MAKRKSVNYPGYSHQNPIPNGSRIGNIAMSSIMNGTEPRISDTAALESDLRHRRVRLLITNSQTAGGVALRAATIARQSGVAVVPISESMPAALDYQAWLMSSLDALQAALENA